MKTRILLAALALGAAACSSDAPTTPELAPNEIRARHNGGYFGSGNVTDADSTQVQDSGYFGGGHLVDPVKDGDSDYTGSGN